MAAALLEPTPKGALALHLLAPWGKGGATWWFETDAGVLLEAKPVAPVETTRTPRVRVVATSGGGGFGKQRLLFAKLRIVRCFSDRATCVCTSPLHSQPTAYRAHRSETLPPTDHHPSPHPGAQTSHIARADRSSPTTRNATPHLTHESGPHPPTKVRSSRVRLESAF